MSKEGKIMERQISIIIFIWSGLVMVLAVDGEGFENAPGQPMKGWPA